MDDNTNNHLPYLYCKINRYIMKASELRIGNLIRFNNLIQTEKIITITPRFFKSSMGDEDFEINNYYHPIVLTEEWINKSGFKKEFDGCYSYGKTGFPIWRNIHNNVVGLKRDEFYSGTGGVLRSVVHLKYVHQLQNLYFALTGEELIIKHGL